MIISDIDKVDGESGVSLPHRLAAIGVSIPVYFYVGSVNQDKPLPSGAVGITNDPAILIRDVLTILSGTARQA